jgi:hypothetical protein
MNQEKIVRLAGKTWRLPLVLPFEKKRGHYFYNVVGYRRPKRGEWFISGGPPEAYYAPNDLSAVYLIAEPTDRAAKEQVWVKKEQR